MCEIKVQVSCHHCHSAKVVKNGKKRTGQQNFKCKNCGRQFQYDYYYQGADPRVKVQIIRHLIRGNGIRDIISLLHVSSYTIYRCIINYAEQCQIKPRQTYYERVIIDELYSFVNSKKKKVWIFYAYAPQTKEILGVTMGKRTTKQLRNLALKIKHLQIEVGFYCTDGLKSFQEMLPKEKHLIGKKFTQAIEGFNTNIRDKLAFLTRRSTTFSKRLKFQWLIFNIFICVSNDFGIIHFKT